MTDSDGVLQERLAEASKRGCHWLGRLTHFHGNGVTAGPDREEAFQQTQYWLHQYGSLADQVSSGN